jgi:hypothetical protein
VKKWSLQREIAGLNRLKQIKNRKYRWPGQLAVYSQPVEVTLYLIPLGLGHKRSPVENAKVDTIGPITENMKEASLFFLCEMTF